MPIDYSKRRENWLKMAEQLPSELRGKISLRNIEAFFKLPLQSRETLAAALNTGLQSVPAAIRHLRSNPDVSVEELVKICQEIKPGSEPDTDSDPFSPQSPVSPPAQSPDPGAIAALAELYQFAHPGSHRIVAQAWAEDPKWDSLVGLVRAWQDLIERPPDSPHSETVIVVTCAFLVKARERLEKLIAEKPAYRQALRMSGVSWPE